MQSDYRYMCEELPPETDAGVYYDNLRKRADYCRAELARADAIGMSGDDIRFLKQMLEHSLNTGD